MILSVLVWLAMWGQAEKMYADMCKRAPSDRYVYENPYGFTKMGGECFIFQKNVGEVYWQAADGSAIIYPIEGAKELNQKKAVNKGEFHAPKPAEHVIEIKTRRDNEPCRDSTDGPDKATFTVNLPKCVKARELWIDGARWGIVKGLD